MSLSLVTFKSAVITAGYRIAKILGWGNIPLTADQVSPFGIDSSPVKNMIAVYAETEEGGDQVIIGYFNRSVMAAPGETRLFSLDPATGNLSIDLWLRTDGTMELGGIGNNLVRYTALNAGIEEQNTKINAELLKIATAIATLGGAYTPEEVSTDISESEINEIKCI